MAKLYNIECHSNEEGNNWEGQFLFSENGSFEGIAGAETDFEQGGALIFGFFSQEGTIELFKTPFADLVSPLLLQGRNEGYKFVGNTYMLVASFGIEQVLCGTFGVTISDAETFGSIEDIEKRKQELAARIDQVKTHGQYAGLYQGFLRAQGKIPSGTRISLK